MVRHRTTASRTNRQHTVWPDTGQQKIVRRYVYTIIHVAHLSINICVKFRRNAAKTLTILYEFICTKFQYCKTINRIDSSRCQSQTLQSKPLEVYQSSFKADELHRLIEFV